MNFLNRNFEILLEISKTIERFLKILSDSRRIFADFGLETFENEFENSKYRNCIGNYRHNGIIQKNFCENFG